MRFWDTSAIVPLLVAERSTNATVRTLREDREMYVWWATGTECVSALARVEREGGSATEGLERLDAFAAGWREIAPTDRVRRTAARLLRVHALRAADALQLAAAMVACEGDPRTLPFVTFDEQLASAAGREGFPVVRPRARRRTR